jgi:hypothetical protein
MIKSNIQRKGAKGAKERKGSIRREEASAKDARSSHALGTVLFHFSCSTLRSFAPLR